MEQRPAGAHEAGGTVFRITQAGTLTTIYNFCSVLGENSLCLDGRSPVAGLVEGSDGNFYGTTEWGGIENDDYCPNVGCGIIFKVTPAGQFTTLYSFCAQTSCARWC